MRLMNKANKSSKGFSLVELLVVVGIGGALVAGALVLGNDVRTKSDIKTHSENISTIYNNMQNMFSNETPDGLSNDVLEPAGIFPSSLKFAGDDETVLTPGGGNVVVTGIGNGFELNYNKVKQTTCVEVIRSQQNVGWDNWAVVADDADADAAAGNAFADTGVPDFTADCNTDSDWVSLAFFIE